LIKLAVRRSAAEPTAPEVSASSLKMSELLRKTLVGGYGELPEYAAPSVQQMGIKRLFSNGWYYLSIWLSPSSLNPRRYFADINANVISFLSLCNL
jgi:hypothetical protein